MADTLYRSKQRITSAALRTVAYSKARDLLEHLEGFGINLVSIVVDSNNWVIVTVADPLPLAHVDHLGLVAL